MGEHSHAPVYDSINGAVHKHNNLPGNTMDLNNPTVEAALIYVAPTVGGNTACVEAENLVASAIYRATKLNCHKLSTSIPHFSRNSIPKNKRHHFGNDILRAPEHLRSLPIGTPIARRLRSQVNSRSTSVIPFGISARVF